MWLAALPRASIGASSGLLAVWAQTSPGYCGEGGGLMLAAEQGESTCSGHVAVASARGTTAPASAEAEVMERIWSPRMMRLDREPDAVRYAGGLHLDLAGQLARIDGRDIEPVM